MAKNSNVVSTKEERAHELWLSMVNELLNIQYMSKNCNATDKKALIILLEDAIKLINNGGDYGFN